MTEPQRAHLAAAQAALLHAVLADGPIPPGFDQDRLRVEAQALRAKRGWVIASVRPDLSSALGERFGPLFDDFARANPRKDGVRVRDDASAFTNWLVDRGELERPRRRWWRRRPQS